MSVKTSQRRFVNVAVLTISDTRSFETDTSGSWLQQAIEADGHHLLDHFYVTQQYRNIVLSNLHMVFSY